jgi:peptidoglycan/LPS O-acetylase OafA/YrhL
VLSGFLITGILLDTKGSAHYFRGFYMRRALRIFPLYYAFLAVAFLGVPEICRYLTCQPSNRPTGLAQAWYWFYVVNWKVLTRAGLTWMAHFWSLAVEEQFYIAWPWVVFVSSRKVLIRLCVGLVACAWLIRLMMFQGGFLGKAYELTPTRLEGLVLGAMAAVIVREPQLLARLQAHLNTVMIAVAGLLAIVIAWAKGFELFKDVVLLNGLTLLAILFTAFLIALLQNMPSVGWIGRFCRTRWMRSMGKYSYAMYVFHVPLIRFLARSCGLKHVVNESALRLPAAWLFAALAVATSYATARASWEFLENPFLRLKRYFPRETSAADEATSSPWQKSVFF